MSDRLGSHLRKLRERRGLSAPKLAEAIGTAHQVIYNLEAGRRKLTRDWAERLAPVLGVSPVELIFPEYAESATEVPVFGYAGAREEVLLPEGKQHAAIDTIELPRSDEGYAAVIVRGDSMIPAYYPGDVLLFLPAGVRIYALEELYNRDCVVMTESGESFVKRVRKGRRPGLVDLVSHNPAIEPLYDQRLRWGAPILWVRRK